MAQTSPMNAAASRQAAAQAARGSVSWLGKLLYALIRGEGYQTNPGNPNGVLLPDAIGESCFDTTNGLWYKAKSVLLNGWVAYGHNEDRYRIYSMDDFTGKAIDTNQWDLQKGSDGATVNFAVNAQIGGAVRATTGAGAGGTMAVNGVQIDRTLAWKAANGNLVFETRLKLSAIASISVFVGFTNQVVALQAPAIGAGGGNTFTANANDAVGFVFDTTMTIADWWLYGCAATVQAAQQDSGIAPVAATYESLRVELSTAGVATFFRNGVQLGTAMAGAVTAATALSPVITAFTRTAASQTVDLDYVLTEQNR